MCFLWCENYDDELLEVFFFLISKRVSRKVYQQWANSLEESSMECLSALYTEFGRKFLEICLLCKLRLEKNSMKCAPLVSRKLARKLCKKFTFCVNCVWKKSMYLAMYRAFLRLLPSMYAWRTSYASLKMRTVCSCSSPSVRGHRRSFTKRSIT